MPENQIPEGWYELRADPKVWHDTLSTGTPYINVKVYVASGELEGDHIYRKLFLTDAALEHTIENLERMGGRFPDGFESLEGLGETTFRGYIERNENGYSELTKISKGKGPAGGAFTDEFRAKAAAVLKKRGKKTEPVSSDWGSDEPF